MITTSKRAESLLRDTPPEVRAIRWGARADRWWAALGLSLLAAYLAQLRGAFTFPALELLQRRDDYRFLSGTLLLLFLLFQLSLGWQRFSGSARKSADQLRSHKRVGAFAPVLFYLHTTSVGWASTFALAAVFLINVAWGYLSQDTLGIRSRPFAVIWLVGHLVLTFALMALALSHAWVAVYYE